jgi:hypothetical protein
LQDWTSESIFAGRDAARRAATDEGAVTLAIKSLQKSEVGSFLTSLANQLSKYDWRTSSTPGLSEAERLRQAVFRGSSGYKEMRRQLVLHLAKGDGQVARAAKKVAASLNYK